MVNSSTKKPDDFILATGKTFSVRDFVELAFLEVGIKIKWSGKGLNELGKDSENGKVLVRINQKYFRPTEVDILQGDYSKAKKVLGWEPKISFQALVSEMVRAELD